MVDEYQANTGVRLGNVAIHFVRHEVARSDMDPDVLLTALPTSASIAQAQHLDVMSAAAASAASRGDSAEWVRIRLELGGGIVACRLDMDDIRRGLGIPAGINFLVSGLVGSTIENVVPSGDNTIPDPDHVYDDEEYIL